MPERRLSNPEAHLILETLMDSAARQGCALGQILLEALTLIGVALADQVKPSARAALIPFALDTLEGALRHGVPENPDD